MDQLNDLPRQKLQEIVTSYGRSISEDPQRCRNLLMDFCGDYRREINILVNVAEEPRAIDLLTASNMPLEWRLTHATKLLHENRGVAEDFARWGVISWALALGIIAEDTVGVMGTQMPGNVPPPVQSTPVSARKPRVPAGRKPPAGTRGFLASQPSSSHLLQKKKRVEKVSLPVSSGSTSEAVILPPTVETLAAKNEYHQFRLDKLYANAFSLGTTELFLLSGVGTLVGIFTQLWFWAIGTVAVLFLLAYQLGYRKTLSLLPLSLIAIVSGAFVYKITLSLASSHYDQVQTSHLWFNTVRMLTLRHQIIAGTCIGAVFSLFGFYVFNSSKDDSFEMSFFVGPIFFGMGGGVIVWLIVTSLGSIFNWGFGFGFGWSINLLCGFFMAAISGIGLICLLYVWSKT